MAVLLTTSSTAVWRRPGLLQIGLDSDRAVLLSGADEATPTLLTLIDGRRSEEEVIQRASLRGLSPEHAAAVLAGLRRCGILADSDDERLPRPAPAPTWVELYGSGPLAEQIWAALNDESADWLSLSRTRNPPRPGPDLVVLAPARGRALDTARWLLSRDVTHLPVVARDSEVVLGPLVLPGRSPCLDCLELYRLGADPTWSQVAAVWDGAAPEPSVILPPPTPVLRAAAALAALCVQALARRDLPATIAATLEVSQDAAVARREWTRHPACGCRWDLAHADGTVESGYE